MKVSAQRGAKVVARGSAKASKNGTAKVKVKVTKAGRRALRKARSVTLTVVAGHDRITVTLKR